MKNKIFTKSIALATSVLLLFSLFMFTSCKKKKAWSQKDKTTWLSNCNVKFTKDGVEPAALKKFCKCALNQIEYDYTFSEIESETIPKSKERDYFNNCSFNY